MAKETRKPRQAPASDPEERENQIINLAMNEAERLIRAGKASSQLLVEFIKRGSTKNVIEKEILERQKELITAKTESLRDSKKNEELFTKAIDAMKRYSGHGDEEGYEDEEDYY